MMTGRIDVQTGLWGPGSKVCPRCGWAQVETFYSRQVAAGGGKQSLAGRGLSSRERQIVDLIRQAKTNKEIAHELSLTVGTVKEYVYRIFRKTGVSNRTKLALATRAPH